MKKLIFLFSISLALFSACSKSNSYTITGKLPDSENNGKKVYLQGIDLNTFEEVTLDSTTINNQLFSFKGNADSTCVRFITIVDPSGNIENMSAIIVEPGEINISIDSATTITGTPMNEKYRELVKQDKAIDQRRQEMDEAYEAQMLQQNVTPEFIESIKAKYSEILKEKGRIRYEYLKDKMESPVGEFFFLSFIMTMEPNQIIELISLSRPDFQKKEQIVKIREQAEMLSSMDLNSITSNN